jgi:hypothetical protein
MNTKTWKKSHRDRKRWRERKLVLTILQLPPYIRNYVWRESQQTNISMNRIIARILKEGLELYSRNRNKFTEG